MSDLHDYSKNTDETKCLHGFWDAKNGLGCVKVPIFQTSTFQFENCEMGF
jgi:O-acetylhomoserine/O-acetylserine sulfhydrylase-like pyridoxal-dependent enzyme